MPTFTYNARTTAGEKSQGAIDAPDRRSALVQLERRGLVPVSVTEAAPATPPHNAQHPATATPTPPAPPP
ncbi:MAG TPA: type II secretion system F family protein, partial [Kiritimatiellia bacterium]|nr:type II secretion system F family protein [Kiritimatiellia bacterium]